MKISSLAECLSCKHCKSTRIDQANTVEVTCDLYNGAIYPSTRLSLFGTRLDCRYFTGLWEAEDENN